MTIRRRVGSSCCCCLDHHVIAWLGCAPKKDLKQSFKLHYTRLLCCWLAFQIIYIRTRFAGAWWKKWFPCVSYCIMKPYALLLLSSDSLHNGCILMLFWNTIFLKSQKTVYNSTGRVVVFSNFFFGWKNSFLCDLFKYSKSERKQ